VSFARSVRPMTGVERAEARGQLADAESVATIAWRGLGDTVSVGCIALVLTAASLIGTMAGTGVHPAKLLATLVVVGMAATVFRVGRDYRAMSELRAALGADLEAGVVEVLEGETDRFFVPSDALYRGRFAYLVELGGGEFLVLNRRRRDVPALTDALFPCRRFRITRLPMARTMLSLETLGEPVTPKRFLHAIGPQEDGAIVRFEEPAA